MLPTYKSKRRNSSKEFSLWHLLTFLKSPGIRRIWYILLLLPVPIITFFLGKFFSPVIRPTIELSSFQAAMNGTRRRIPAPNKNWDRFAFALKTGKDVALKRTPIQLMTFLQPVKNIILIGEEPGVYVADYPMIDVVSATLKDASDVGYVKAPKMQHDPVEGHLVKRALEEVTVDQDSKGWKLDAKKNIPGFKVLYDKFPDVDWYVMIDDDTYMFMDNVLDKLKHFDPNEPHYLGAPTNFIGCDGVKRWGDSIYFAHGGSGIVISRGAMLKMIPLVDSCIPKYDSCWAGDIRTALCLRDAGILVENAGYFSPNAPNDRFNFSYPCATPRTFHHLLSSQIQKLFELEMVAKAQSQTILLDDVFRAFLDDSPKLNYDRPGGDFKSAKTSTADECKSLCASITKCVAYTFENGGCHLKSTAPPIRKRNTGCVTGLITSHFVCNKH